MLLLLLAAAVLADAVDPGLTDVDLKALASMPATAIAGEVVVHFDPATVRSADAEREAVRAREALALLETRLGTRLEGAAHVFLYRDREQFRVSTNSPHSWGGFASGARSLHVPRGAPLLHELCHLLALRFPGCSGKDPGGFLREGLAAAMEGTDRGAPVSSSAAVYARLGVLPPLRWLREKWPEEPVDGVHPYAAAGAFVGWLFDTAGAAKLKAVYAEPERAEEILGRGWDALEAAWRESLETRVVPQGEEDVIRRHMGLPSDLLPVALVHADSEIHFVGTGLAGWVPRRSGVWVLRDGLLTGTGGGEGWEFLDSDPTWDRPACVRASVRIGEGGGLMLRVNRREGASDEALVTGEGSLLTVKGGQEGFARAAVRLVPGRWTEVLLAQERGDARLYLDRRLVLEAKGAFGVGRGGVAIGFQGASLEIRDAAVLFPRGK
jgi:hypothetical protein